MRFFTPIIDDPALVSVPKQHRLLVVSSCQRQLGGVVVDQILSGLCFSAICLAVLLGLSIGFFRAGFWGARGVITLCVIVVTFTCAVFSSITYDAGSIVIS